MENRAAKTGGNAGRRIRWFAAAIALAGVAYSGGWFWLAGRVEDEARRAMAAQAAGGTDVGCSGLVVTGYPFRLEVRCDSVRLDRADGGLSVRAGGFRSAAQVYEPRRIIAELDSPVRIENAVAEPIELDWALGRASAVVAQPLPQRASVSVDEFSAAPADGEPLLRAGHLEAHMRQNGDALDLAMRYDGLSADTRLTGGRELPVLAGDADVSIEDGVRLAVNGVNSLRGIAGEIRRAALLVTPDRGILLSGPFSIGEDGLLDATLELFVVDPAGLAEAFKPALPEYAAQIETLAAAQPVTEPGKVPELKLPVSIRDGEVRLGFVTLGQIPPVN